ncbi:hypothetical protein [Kribbella sp. DT2]|uniref:hypothetical protein n=1 Tax=Kribbella sp. DT2 TaxID=3393427 RepID=UPI003CF2BEAF
MGQQVGGRPRVAEFRPGVILSPSPRRTTLGLAVHGRRFAEASAEDADTPPAVRRGPRLELLAPVGVPRRTPAIQPASARSAST